MTLMRADRRDLAVEVTFLLVSDQAESPWSLTLAEALAPLGHLHIVSEQEASEEIRRARYDVVIVDTTAVKEVAPLVTRLHAQQPEARMVVATLSPTWQRAREVMQAGAFDYIRKSLNKEETLVAIREILKRPGPGSTS
jgi:DNA-binding NtrC family response regulator